MDFSASAGRLAFGVLRLRFERGAVELLRREVGGGVLPLLREDEDARFVADDDVGQLVAIHIADLHIDADAAFGIDEVRDEIDAAFAIALRLIPIDDAVAALVGVVAVVRPVALAGDDVLDAVAVDVREVRGVRLGEDDAVVVVLRLLAGEHHPAFQVGSLIRRLRGFFAGTPPRHSDARQGW
jgi:hypothetical protein